MNKSSAFDWHWWFKQKPGVQDDQRCGHTKKNQHRAAANVATVRTLVRSYRRLGVRRTAEELNMSRETMQQIIMEDMRVRKPSAMTAPRILTDDQKQRRLHTSSAILHNVEMFDMATTGDETWCSAYDPETKPQSVQWKAQKSLPPKTTRMCCLQFKTMLVRFCGHKGPVHYQFFPQGQTVNQQRSLEVPNPIGEDPNFGLASRFSTMTMPLNMMR
jgi:hypothetical protein